MCREGAGMPIRVNFEQELNNLKKSLAEMGKNVELSIDRLFDAMTNMDEGMTEALVKNERIINDMERAIEAQCLSLITRQQPIVGDLRLISAALKVVTDIERVGDHAVDIAELMLRWKGVNLLECSPHIPPMIEASKEMVHSAVEAFINQDSEHARRVIESDDIVDELFNKVKNDVINVLKQQESNSIASETTADLSIDVMMIAKYLEKVGDHAVNIADWEIFRVTGSSHNVKPL